jgi:heat shock protein HslJ
MTRVLIAVAAMLAAVAAWPAVAQQTAPVGKWLAEDIGGGVVDRLQTTMEIAENGQVSGSGGCNRYHGTVEFSITAISFGPLASTKMACPAAAMEQEAKFHKALGEVKAWRIDAGTRKLTLLDAKGGELMRFAPLE